MYRTEEELNITIPHKVIDSQLVYEQCFYWDQFDASTDNDTHVDDAVQCTSEEYGWEYDRSVYKNTASQKVRKYLSSFSLISIITSPQVT